MKNKLTLLLFILMAVAFQQATAQTKHALIFAIGNYPEKGGWEAISSNRDVSFIKATLSRQGFQENNIHILTDAAATPEGITNALTGLINNVKPGDIAVIHFSSHGEQVEDDNGDETDGLDESIVTFNAVAPSLSKDFKKDQAEYFRDDQFGYYINQLRNKLGKNGDVVVFMDLCHSGTGTRGTAKVRGGQPALVSPGFKPGLYSDTGSGLFKESNTSKNDEQSLSTYMVFSAARAGELSFETKDDDNQEIGPLSYAITKVFQNLDAATTYRSLFARIQSVMNSKVPGQHPVMEGNGMDRALFGGKFAQQKPYIEIEKIESDQLAIKSGKLSGLDSGAKVVVYPSGTTDPANATALASGTVINASYFRATVKLDKELRITQPAAGWVFVKQTVYVIEPISVTTAAHPDSIAIKQALKDLPLISFKGSPELSITKGITEDSLKIVSNGYLFTTIKNTASHPDELKEKIQRYVQYKFLQGLEVVDRNANVEVKLVPVLNGRADTAAISSKVINGTYTFNEGDRLVLWVKNTGKVPVYFNVLDMQPDGILNPLMPNKQKKIFPGDLKIDAGMSRLLTPYTITVSPPYGTEIFKIFASRKDIDMENVIATGREGTRGTATAPALESIIKKLYDAGRGQREVISVSNTDGSIYSLLFEISKKEK
jgi:hypothetical protein